MAVPRLNSGMRKQAVSILQEGESRRKIARRFNIHPCTIILLLRWYHQTRSINNSVRPVLLFVTMPRTFNKRTYGSATCGIDLQLLQLHGSKRVDVVVGPLILEQNIETP